MTRVSAERFKVTDLVNMEAEQAVATVLERAAEFRASDLFFLSDQRFVTIAIRRLGSVEKMAVVSTEHGRQLLTYIKANAGMDISERRRPADGRWIHEMGPRKLDLRINCTPTLYGEDMAARIWDHSSELYSLTDLGMARNDYNKLLFMLGHPSGLILVTGPTGTGKNDNPLRVPSAAE